MAVGRVPSEAEEDLPEAPPVAARGGLCNVGRGRLPAGQPGEHDGVRIGGLGRKGS